MSTANPDSAMLSSEIVKTHSVKFTNASAIADAPGRGRAVVDINISLKKV
jgi:hypothetical protein